MFIRLEYTNMTRQSDRQTPHNGVDFAMYSVARQKAGVMIVTDVFHGLLLPSDVERRPASIRPARQHNGTASKHQDVGRDLEAGHVLPQRTRIILTHHHLLQQTVSH